MGVNNKHIELFLGSLSELEKMTGKSYRSIRKENGELMVVDTSWEQKNKFVEGGILVRNRLESLEDARRLLVEKALAIGADALVNVMFDDNIIVYNHHVRFAPSGVPTLISKGGVYGQGYAVKAINKKEYLFKDWEEPHEPI